MASRLVEGMARATERHLVVFSLDGQRYALPVACVQKLLRVVAITPLPEAPPIILGIFDLGGVVIPVVDVRQRFNHPPREVRLSDHLLVATTRKLTVALLVDETTGVMAASVDAYVAAGEIAPGIGLLDGAMKLEDGLVLIHDLERLLSLGEEEAIERALAVSRGLGILGKGGGGAVENPETESG